MLCRFVEENELRIYIAIVRQHLISCRQELEWWQVPSLTTPLFPRQRVGESALQAGESVCLDP